jgi:hypothetical protein
MTMSGRDCRAGEMKWKHALACRPRAALDLDFAQVWKTLGLEVDEESFPSGDLILIPGIGIKVSRY